MLNRNNLSYSPLWLCGFSLFSTFAYAQGVAQHCLTITHNEQRLACFDDAYAQHATMPSATKQTDEPNNIQTASNHSADTNTQSHTVSVTTNDIAQNATPSVLEHLYDLNQNHADGILTIREHNHMYLMPIWYNTSPNRSPYSSTRDTTNAERYQKQQRSEAKMQISFKTKLWEDVFNSRADLWFAYTQKSDWQVWNQGKQSAPFRNHDYSPEILLTHPVKSKLPWGGQLRLLGTGFIHESNGQSRPESRSWNRAYIMAGMEWNKLTVLSRLWLRVDSKGDEDDNPDINRYMGYGDLKLKYQIQPKHHVLSTLRFNPRSGKGAIELGYTFPIKGKLNAYVRGFHGYGENLIDYNHKQTGIGIGFMFRDWLGM